MEEAFEVPRMRQWVPSMTAVSLVAVLEGWVEARWWLVVVAQYFQEKCLVAYVAEERVVSPERVKTTIHKQAEHTEI